MTLKFATKRNINGNRTYLAIDTEAKVFSREPQSWYCREETSDFFAEITLKDLRKLLAKVKAAGYTEIEAL